MPVDLFEWAEQQEELDRVASVLAAPILDFCRAHVGRQFHMLDLRSYLTGRGFFFAPDSPSRILRELRLQGRVNYVVVNRARSLYEVLP